MRSELSLNSVYILVLAWWCCDVSFFAGRVDQWVQKRRNVTETNGRRNDGVLAKAAIGLIVVAFFIFYETNGGSQSSVDGCVGSMRC